MKLMVTLLFLAVILQGCMTMGIGFYYPKIAVKQKITTPEIGAISYASLGESLITSGNGYYSTVIIVSNSTTYKDYVGGKMTIHRGVYELSHKDASNEYYYPVSDHQITYTAPAGNLVEEYDYELRISSDNQIVVVVSQMGGSEFFGGEYFSKEVKYDKIDDYLIVSEDDFQQTLVYTGKAGTTVRFSYREFTNDMIRPAFTTDISYDLSESSIIGFKSFKAEVLSATNMSIEYKILSGF